jgi:asparagine synthetase B (glutamine-hydrolysing)
MKPNIKEVIKNCVSNIPDQEVALCLSSGMDSNSILFELIEQGKKVTAFTFTMEGIASRDFIHAKKNCEAFGVDLIRVELPNSVDKLKEAIYKLARMGAKTKADFECFFPFLYLYEHPALTQKYILSGLGGTGHFCITKKGMIHFRDTKIDEFRSNLYSNPNHCQKNMHDQVCESLGKVHIMPYMTQEMINEFNGVQWVDINKPKEKQAILENYKDWFSKVKVFRHTNFHKGDSGISTAFLQLVHTDLNKGNFKTPKGIYNDIIDEVKSEQ